MMYYEAMVNDGIATISDGTMMTCTVGGSTTLPPTNSTIAASGWWDGYGIWHPYFPVPVAAPVYISPIVLPQPDLSPEQKLAIETLKLGAKVPKAMRDKALKLLAKGLDGKT